MGYILAQRIAERVLDTSPQAKATLEHLAQYADNDGGGVFVSAQRLALERGLSVRAIKYHIRELSGDPGWLLDDGWVSHRPPVKLRRIAVERLAAYPLAKDLMPDKVQSAPDVAPCHKVQSSSQGARSDSHKVQEATLTKGSTLHPNQSVRQSVRQSVHSVSNAKAELSGEQLAEERVAFKRQLVDAGICE